MQKSDTADSIRTAAMHLNVYVTRPSSGSRISGVLADFTAGEATFIIKEAIVPGTKITVGIRGFAMAGIVLRCVPESDRYNLRVCLNGDEEFDERKTPRFPVSIPARVFVPDLIDPVNVRIVDISGAGIGIQLSMHLPPQTLVAIESASNLALGVVRFSQELTSGRIRVGVQLYHIVRETKADRLGVVGRKSQSPRD